MILGVDSEFAGLDSYHGKSCPFYVSMFSGESPFYWAWEWNPVERTPIIPKGDLEEIADYLQSATEIVGQNIKAELASLASVGLLWRKEWYAKTHDTLYAAHLLASGEPHGLDVLALKYLRINIQPFEEKLVAACKEARKIAMREFPKWRIAKKDDPCLPSSHTTKSKDKDEVRDKDDKSQIFRCDYWLPGHIAKVKGYPANHLWHTVLSDYANVDPQVTRGVWIKQKQELEKRDLWKVYEHRRKLIPIIFAMERRGVTYSDERLKELKTTYKRISGREASNCIKCSQGQLKEIGTGTTKAMRSLLLEHWKLPVLKRSKKTKEPSLDKDVLAAWEVLVEPNSHQHRFIKSLRNKRKKDKNIGAMEGYERFGIPVPKHPQFRVLHASYNPVSQATLRWNSQNPATQTVAKQPDDDGYSLRYLFGPEAGREWWRWDYSNIELRIPAYEAGEQAMIDLFEKPDEAPFYGSYHLLVASIIWPEEFEGCLRRGVAFNDPIEKGGYKETLYQWIKNGNFAVTYGAIEESGTADRAYHKEGAHRLIKSRFTKIAALNEKLIAMAQRCGYVETMEIAGVGKYPIQVGRTYNSYTGRMEIRPTTPLNYHSQSTAMNCMGSAMLKVYDYLNSLKGDHYITLQVHDELVISMPKGKTPRANLPKVLKVKELMEYSGNEIGVPLVVDFSYHPSNWKDAVSIEEVQAA